MKDYYFDVEVCTSRPVSNGDVFKILEALDEFYPASTHKEGGYGVELAMAVRTDRGQDHAWKVAKGEVARAFREELGDDEALVDLSRWRTPMTDSVNHPAHYTWLPVEPIEIIEHLAYNRGAACKYLIRAGLKSKDTEIEDLEKSLWYIQREIERLKNAG